MQTITPFAIPSEPKFELEIPRAAVIRNTSVTGGQPYLWIQHDSEAILIWRTFILVPGMGKVPSNLDVHYIGCFNTKANRIFIFEQIQDWGGNHDD